MGESGDVVVPDGVGAGFSTELGVNVVQITSSLELSVPETLERRVGLLYLTLLNVPSGRLHFISQTA